MFLKNFKSEFSYIEIWFTDQNSKSHEEEDKLKVHLVISESATCKNDSLISSTERSNICKQFWISIFSEKIEKKTFAKIQVKN